MHSMRCQVDPFLSPCKDLKSIAGQQVLGSVLRESQAQPSQESKRDARLVESAPRASAVVEQIFQLWAGTER